MKVSKVTYGFTKNIGNYQSARAEVTVDLDPDDDHYEAMALARSLVKLELDMPLSAEEDILVGEFDEAFSAKGSRS